MIIAFRKRHGFVRRSHYLWEETGETPTLRTITWHGVKPGEPDFSGSSRFIAWVLEAFATQQRSDVPIYVGTNTYWEPLTVELPRLTDRRWYRVVDTARKVGEDIVSEEDATFLQRRSYVVQPRSTIVLVGRLTSTTANRHKRTH